MGNVQGNENEIPQECKYLIIILVTQQEIKKLYKRFKKLDTD